MPSFRFWRSFITAACLLLLLTGLLSITPITNAPVRAVPVLCYHEINPETPDKWSRSPRQLEEDFKALAANGIEVITLEQYLQRQLSETLRPDSSVVLTFDDATAGQFLFARPLLKQYNYPATFYVPTEPVKKKVPVSSSYSGIMTWQDLQTLADEGFQLASHGHTHRSFAGLPPEAIWEEIEQSRMTLQERTGISTSDLCLPYGEYRPDQEAAMQKAGLRSIALTTTDHGKGDPVLIKIRRFEVKSFTSQADVIKAVLGRP